jgi:nucleotide-binding universal stress UspA family protein
MFKTIVVALDGSENAEKAIPWVKRLAGHEKALVVAVRAVAWPLALDAQFLEAEMTEAREYLLRIEREFNYAGFATQTVARVGAAPKVVTDLAEEHRADLVVMTTRGGSTVSRWLVGGNAEQVMRSAAVPVLLVRSQMAVPRQPRISRIVVPMDGSDLAAEIVPWAADLAAFLGGAIQFLHVTPPGLKAAYQDVLAALERRMEAVVADLRKRGVKSALRVETGDPADRILKAAARSQLVATTTHGYGGVKRWLFGSVAEKVVHESPVPVFVYRAGGGARKGRTAASAVAARE